ncbi:MAG TPA: FAD-dependent oxidoreductase [Acetobacteraceae bacterium]|jgi:D-amino-acid dehydrogenase
MPRVVVIGAGVVGAATAVELVRDGHQVTILEPGEPGGEQSASYGNGTQLNPSSVIPMTAPGIWRKVPGWLADPLGPLAIRWSYLPALLPWLGRFLRAGATEARVAATARALRPLLLDAPERHRRLAEEAGVGDLITRQGVLYVFPTRADFEAEALAWRLRRENGVRWLELNGDELRQREPSLSRRYTFGLLVEENGQCRDPGAYVAALVRHGVAQGAALRREKAVGFRIEGARLRAVLTERSEIAADRAVIAAGAWSHTLAAAAGDQVPLETERGYHVVIADPGIAPRYPVSPSDGKMACVMTPQGLRLAGQVELAGLAAAPNWRRAGVLRDFARRVFPNLPSDLPATRVKTWMGHRPSTPDGLPCIGPASGCADVIYAFGHGHVGLTAAATTGRLAADLVAGNQPAIDPTPYAAKRFRGARVPFTSKAPAAAASVSSAYGRHP